GDDEIGPTFDSGHAHRAVRRGSLHRMIRVHPGAERNGAVEQGPDEELTLDVPDRVHFGNRPALQNTTALVERTRLAQHHAVLTYSLEHSEAFEDAQCVGLDEDAGADLAHGGAALEYIDRPAGSRQRNGRAQARNPAAANNGCPHQAPATSSRVCARAEKV